MAHGGTRQQVRTTHNWHLVPIATATASCRRGAGRCHVPRPPPGQETGHWLHPNTRMSRKSPPACRVQCRSLAGENLQVQHLILQTARATVQTLLCFGQLNQGTYACHTPGQCVGKTTASARSNTTLKYGDQVEQRPRSTHPATSPTVPPRHLPRLALLPTMASAMAGAPQARISGHSYSVVLSAQGESARTAPIHHGGTRRSRACSCPAWPAQLPAPCC